MSAMEGSYRLLTDWERRLIQRLLASPFLGRDALLLQLDHGVASSIDEDGTPLDENGSLYLDTSSPAKACVRARVPTEAKAPDIDAVMIHYLLFVDDDGKMDQLEVFKEDSSKVLRHAEPEELEVMVAG
ncbi:MAG: hypothetical protein IMZ65_01275 [Planctomycetes bacterium]|nr:hypothetical protein [Planctomycetota bacterium]